MAREVRATGEMPVRAGFLAGVLLPSLLAAPPPAPQAGSGALVEEALSELQVVVTDRDGVPVHGLRAGDLAVLHDGRRIAVASFAEIQGDAHPSARILRPGGSWLTWVRDVPLSRPRPQRRLVVFLDRIDVPDPGSRAEVFDAIRGLLEGFLGDGDEAMIVTWDRSVRTVLPFTSDPAALEETLAAAEQVPQRSPRAWRRAALEAGRTWFPARLAPQRDGERSPEPEGPTTPAALGEGSAVEDLVAALKGAVAALGGGEGRRALVLLSSRFSFPAGLGTSRDAGGRARSRAARASRERDTRPLLEELVRSANALGVPIYGIDPVGRETPETEDGTRALGLVAGRTGGIAGAGPGAVAPFFGRVAAELDSWYSLGIAVRPEASRAAALDVKARNPNLHARTCRSLVGRTPDEEMHDRTLAHLFSPDPGASIPFEVAATTGSSPEAPPRLLLELRIPAESLVLAPATKGRAAAVSIIAIAASPDGSISGIANVRRALEIPKEGSGPERAETVGVSVDAGAPRPGSRISVSVRDERTGLVGFAIARDPEPGR